MIAFPWAILGWSPPGSREAGREAGAADLRSFERRIEKARRLVPTLDAATAACSWRAPLERCTACSTPRSPRRRGTMLRGAVAETAWASVGDAGLAAITATFAAIGSDAVVTLHRDGPSRPATAPPGCRRRALRRGPGDRPGTARRVVHDDRPGSWRLPCCARDCRLRRTEASRTHRSTRSAMPHPLRRARPVSA